MFSEFLLACLEQSYHNGKAHTGNKKQQLQSNEYTGSMKGAKKGVGILQQSLKKGAKNICKISHVEELELVTKHVSLEHRK